jgi:hypothetical protein
MGTPVVAHIEDLACGTLVQGCNSVTCQIQATLAVASNGRALCVK